MSNEHPFEWQDNPKWTKYFESVPGLCTNIIFHEHSQLTSTGGQPLSCSIVPPTRQTKCSGQGSGSRIMRMRNIFTPWSGIFEIVTSLEVFLPHICVANC